MSLRILHVLDHSVPLHSGYTFRTLAILREQRRLGWETFHLTSPKHVGCDAAEEVVEGLHFYRTAGSEGTRLRVPGLDELGLMRQLEQRLLQVAEQVRPHVLHAHSPVLNAIPALRVGKRLDIPRAGEHTAAIAAELGFDAAEIRALVEEGVLGIASDDNAQKQAPAPAYSPAT